MEEMERPLAGLKTTNISSCWTTTLLTGVLPAHDSDLRPREPMMKPFDFVLIFFLLPFFDVMIDSF
jgi:hypothetical protein